MRLGEKNMDKLVDMAIELQALAQAGLAYGKDILLSLWKILRWLNRIFIIEIYRLWKRKANIKSNNNWMLYYD